MPLFSSLCLRNQAPRRVRFASLDYHHHSWHIPLFLVSVSSESSSPTNGPSFLADRKSSGAFKLYDVDNDGYITREEMYDIVGAIYEMLGSAKRPDDGLQAADATSDEAPNVRVDRIFELLDSVSALYM